MGIFPAPWIDEPALGSRCFELYTVADIQAVGSRNLLLAGQSTDRCGMAWLMPVWQFTVSPVPPAAPILTAPVNNVLTNDPTPSFSWNSVAEGERYEIEIDTSTAFNTTGKQAEVLSPGELTYAADTLADGKYFWRVRALNSYGYAGAWSVN